MLATRLNRPGHEIVDHRTYVIASDGDLQEGVASEACSLAGHLGLGRLIGFYDDNHISIEGDTALSFSEDVAVALRGLRLARAAPRRRTSTSTASRPPSTPRRPTQRPSLIVVRTHIAPGSPNKQDTHGAHGAPLGEEEIKLTKEAYGWPSLEPFFIPDEALEHFRECVPRGEELEAAWRERFEAYRAEFPDEAAELERILARGCPRAGTPRSRARAPTRG